MTRAGRRSRGRGPGGDDGLILPLLIVYVMIAMGLIVVVVDVTAVHLQRSRLYALADAAALNAANALDTPRFYDREALAPGSVPLSDRTVRSSVRDFLPAAASHADLRLVQLAMPTGAPDQRTAEVTLTARARLPIAGGVVHRWWAGVPLRVTVAARSQRPA